MLALMDLVAVPDLADVDRVLEQRRQRSLAERDAADRPAIAIGPALGDNAPVIEFVDQRSDRAQLDIALED